MGKYISKEEEKIVRMLAKKYNFTTAEIYEIVRAQTKFVWEINERYISGIEKMPCRITLKNIGVFSSKRLYSFYNRIRNKPYNFTLNGEEIRCSIEEIYDKVRTLAKGKSVKFFSRRKILIDIYRRGSFEREGEGYSITVTVENGKFI